MTQLIQRFLDRFDGAREGMRTCFAPGRVNLIGEHIDYNGGSVLPCALHLGTFAVARRRPDDQVRFFSENLPHTGMVTRSLDDLAFRPEDGWANYPKGVVQALQQIAPLDTGLDLLFYGTLPIAAGLSSSASLELATALSVNLLYDLGRDPLFLAQLAQRVENDYIGLQSGIMDQFTAAVARPDHALLLNCQTLEHRHIPLDLGNYALVIADTRHPRGLADSAYNQRRAVCDRALQKIQNVLPVHDLASLAPEQLTEVNGLLTPEENRRVRHVVHEQARTLQAATTLEQGDLLRFGELLNESHRSLRDDYQVTGPVLDLLVDLAQEQPATLGARMTGAGFGGCTINLVQAGAVHEFAQAVGRAYEQATGHSPRFYPVRPGGGARVIQNDREVDAT